METHCIEEAREASSCVLDALANDLAEPLTADVAALRLESTFTVISRACEKYFRRKLGECGDARSVAHSLLSDRGRWLNSIELLTEIIATHAASQVEKATAEFKEERDELKKQCEELRVSLQLKASEAFINAQERDSLRNGYKEEKAIVSRIWEYFGNPSYESLRGRSIIDLISAVHTERDSLRHKLSQLQQDVMPLLERYTVADQEKLWHELIEAFLAKHPDLRIES